MKKARKILLITILSLISAAFHISCDGGSSGDQSTQTTTINGRITNIIASAQKEERSFKFANIVDLITFIKEAKAQGGVLVTAIIDGITVASRPGEALSGGGEPSGHGIRAGPCR